MILIVILSCFSIASARGKLVFFTATGTWEYPESSQMNPFHQHNCKHFMCTPSNLTWIPSPNLAIKTYNSTTGCAALLRKGVKHIYFHGDSYMRQIYAALLITLKGDYKYGSIGNSSSSPECAYQRQFFEKRCGTRQLNHYGKVCDDKIILDPFLIGFNDLTPCARDTGSVVLWSFGNYKLSRYGRNGVNNSTMYSAHFMNSICGKIKSHQTHQSPVSSIKQPMNRHSEVISNHTKCSIWWISTHYRMKAYFDDEKPQLVREYNEGMRRFFEDSSLCGRVNYIDVYNMTRSIGVNHKQEAEKMTYDGVHWGMELNLIKAQIVLNALLASSSES